MINPRISLFSGRNINVDSSKGLIGYFDFLLTDNPDKLTIKAPVVAVVDAKNENINEGLAQGFATMYAARLINQGDPKMGDRPVYGTVTTGQEIFGSDKRHECYGRLDRSLSNSCR